MSEPITIPVKPYDQYSMAIFIVTSSDSQQLYDKVLSLVEVTADKQGKQVIEFGNSINMTSPDAKATIFCCQNVFENDDSLVCVLKERKVPGAETYDLDETETGYGILLYGSVPLESREELRRGKLGDLDVETTVLRRETDDSRMREEHQRWYDIGVMIARHEDDPSEEGEAEEGGVDDEEAGGVDEDREAYSGE